MLETTTTRDADAVVATLKGAIEAGGLRLAGHIDGQANAARIGETVPVDQVLEVFHPRYALRVWAACKPAGIDIPLRIHLYDDGSGRLHVTCRLPSAVFAPWGRGELDVIGAELDPIFRDIIETVAEA